ncbi:unnamed protein product, partial [Didymodactylos carnosus]
MHSYNTRSKGILLSTTILSLELKSQSSTKLQEMDTMNEDGRLLTLSDDKGQDNTSTTISRTTVTGKEDGHVSSSDSNDINGKSHAELQNDARIDFEQEVSQERLLSLVCEPKTLFKIPLFDDQPPTCFTDAQEWLDIAIIQLQK